MISFLLPYIGKNGLSTTDTQLNKNVCKNIIDNLSYKYKIYTGEDITNNNHKLGTKKQQINRYAKQLLFYIKEGRNISTENGIVTACITDKMVISICEQIDNRLPHLRKQIFEKFIDLEKIYDKLDDMRNKLIKFKEIANELFTNCLDSSSSNVDESDTDSNVDESDTDFNVDESDTESCDQLCDQGSIEKLINYVNSAYSNLNKLDVCDPVAWLYNQDKMRLNWKLFKCRLEEIVAGDDDQNNIDFIKGSLLNDCDISKYMNFMCDTYPPGFGKMINEYRNKGIYCDDAEIFLKLNESLSSGSDKNGIIASNDAIEQFKCHECNEKKTIDKYSKNQLKKNNSRRCKTCVLNQIPRM